MKRQGLIHRPTTAELAILRVLWRRGPSTVREVQAELGRDRPTGYTTVLKLLQITRPDVAYFGQKDAQQRRIVGGRGWSAARGEDQKSEPPRFHEASRVVCRK